MSCHRPSAPSEIRAIPSLHQNFRLGILGGTYLTPSHLPWYWCYQNSFIPSTRSITMSEILWLVVGIRAPKGLSHDFSHPSDAYAYVVVVRSRDDVVRGNCARAGFAWRSARQSLS